MAVKEDLSFNVSVRPTVVEFDKDDESYGAGFDLLHGHVLDSLRKNEERKSETVNALREANDRATIKPSQLDPKDHRVEVVILETLKGALAPDSDMNLDLQFWTVPPKLELRSRGATFDSRAEAEEWDDTTGVELRGEQQDAAGLIMSWLGTLAHRKARAADKVAEAKNNLYKAETALEQEFVIKRGY